MVSKSRKRISEKFKRIQVILCVCFLIVGCLSSFAFASDSYPEQEPFVIEEAPYFAPDLDMQRIMEAASDIKAVTATEYTTTDIYNLLYSAIRGSSSATTYSLPYIANRANSIYTRLGSMQTNDITTQGIIQNIYTKTSDLVSIFAGTTTGLNPFFDFFHIDAGSHDYSIAQLTGMIWSLVQDLNTSSNSQVSYLSAINSSLLSSHDISWTDLGFSYVGTSLNYDTNFLTSPVASKSFKVVFRASSTPYVTPSVIRLYVPFLVNNSNNITSPLTLSSIKKYSNGTFSDFVTDIDYFVEHASNGTYFYIFNFWKRGNVDYYFEVSSPSSLWFYSAYTPTIDYVDFNTYDYQLLRTSFYNARSSGNLDSILSDISTLSNYFVSPEKQQAENASREVIDDTLDNFTGSGSASVKRSDTSSAKDISNSLKSGLDMGGSTSNALSVFSSANAFWGWFSQDNANYFTLYVPSRSCSSDYSDIIWTDDIPNSLDKINEEVQRELNSK